MKWLLFIVLSVAAGCVSGPARPPEGDIIAPPPQYLEMCRDRYDPILCPEVTL